MSGLDPDCIQQICSQPSVCAQHYYQLSNFIYEKRMWPFIYFYGSYVTMLFSHEPWSSFGSSSIILMFQEIITAIAVYFDLPFFPSRVWDPGETLFIMFFQIAGVTSAMILISTLDTPRIIRSPHEEMRQLSREYGTEWDKDDLNEVLEFPEKEYKNLRWKYISQLGLLEVLSIVSGLMAYLDLDPQFQDSNWARVDWLSFSFLNLVLIASFYMWNWTSKIETDLIWRKDRRHYVRFYATWFFSFLLLILPGVYMFLPTKLSGLLSILLIFILLSAVAVTTLVKRWKLHYPI